MSQRTATRLALGIAAAGLCVVASTATLVFLNRSHFHSIADANPIELILPIGYFVMGVLIASRRRENPIGWIFLAIGFVASLPGVTEQYVLRDLTTGPGRLPGTAWMAWLQNWVVLLIFPASLVPLVFLLFPDGHLPSRRWAIVLWVGAAITAPALVSAMLQPRIQLDFTRRVFHNPIGVAAIGNLYEGPVGVVYWLGGMGVLVTAAVGVFLRLRRSRGEVRQQLKWFAYAVVATVALLVINVLSYFLFEVQAQDVAFDIVIVLGFGVGIPVACGIAILKHGLYEIDVVINRTVVYGLLAAFFTVVYVGIVVGIGTAVGSRSNTFLTILAAVVIAVAFQPLRERARRVANRMVYGERATPYEVLSEFAERMAGAYATEDILPRMARILGEGTGAAGADVWLRVGTQLRPAARWPASGDGAPRRPPLTVTDDEFPNIPGVGAAMPVRHHGELLGALSVTKPPAEPLTPAEQKLVSDLAAQAGLVLRNVRLTEELKANLNELRASRQRIVTAQDQERRRLERNIHDGAQQQLVSIAVKLRLVEALIARDPERAAEMARQVGAETTDALETLRDLARGIYPPLLVDGGLGAALSAQARKVSLPVSVEIDGLERYPQEVEGAVYFCVLEALQNVAKYAEASRAIVRLEAHDGHLSFTVTDEGVGFDPTRTSFGTGLQGMEDRLSALGGELSIRSEPGTGTTVTGVVPVRMVQALA